MNTTNKIWPLLFGLSSTGKMKQWSISVDIDDNNYGVITTAHGYVEQTITVNHKHINKGKNIGKANETTPYEQAISEAQSTYNKKIDDNYNTLNHYESIAKLRGLL